LGISKMVSIKTDRLLLREFVDSDLLAVHEYAQDRETTKFLDWGPNSLRETTVVLSESVGFQHDKPRTTIDLAVTELATAKLIGGCSIAILDQEKRIAGLGYILNRAAWGKGYASEAAQALLNMAFDDLAMQKVLASCDSENTASENVMIKLGMLKEAHLPEIST